MKQQLVPLLDPRGAVPEHLGTLLLSRVHSLSYSICACKEQIVRHSLNEDRGP